MQIPKFWPNGQPVCIDDVMRFLDFKCGVVLCAGCGTVLARCGCGKEDTLNTLESCYACRPPASPK